MALSTKMWLRKGCDKIYTKKNAHECRPDDGHRWQFVWAQDGMAVSGGGMPYGEIDTDYTDGRHNVQPLPLALPDRPFEQFHIIRDRYNDAMTTPAIAKIEIDADTINYNWDRLSFGRWSVEVRFNRLHDLEDGFGQGSSVWVHTPDESIFWITNGKRFALLGFA